jgi:hypothetical protein
MVTKVPLASIPPIVRANIGSTFMKSVQRSPSLNHCQRGYRGEFQKIIDHRCIVKNSPIGALAHLGLARAYVLQGDAAKAKAAYQDFLTLWKDADPDIPILKQAKAECAKLQ